MPAPAAESAGTVRDWTPNGTFGYTYGRTNAQGLPVIESATWSGASGTAYLANDDTGSPVGLSTTAGGHAVYVYNAQGSPVALVGDTNTTAFTYSFDPYGVANDTYNSGTDAYYESPFLYTNGLNDRTTGWTKDGNRYYSSTVGRWTQRDTLDAPLDAANANRYEYAADNPINYLDPLGQFSIKGFLGATIGGLTGGCAAGAVTTIWTGPGALAGCGIGAAGGAAGGAVTYVTTEAVNAI